MGPVTFGCGEGGAKMKRTSWKFKTWLKSIPHPLSTSHVQTTSAPAEDYRSTLWKHLSRISPTQATRCSAIKRLHFWKQRLNKCYTQCWDRWVISLAQLPHTARWVFILKTSDWNTFSEESTQPKVINLEIQTFLHKSRPGKWNPLKFRADSTH